MTDNTISSLLEEINKQKRINDQLYQNLDLLHGRLQRIEILMQQFSFVQPPTGAMPFRAAGFQPAFQGGAHWSQQPYHYNPPLQEPQVPPHLRAPNDYRPTSGSSVSEVYVPKAFLSKIRHYHEWELIPPQFSVEFEKLYARETAPEVLLAPHLVAVLMTAFGLSYFELIDLAKSDTDTSFIEHKP